MSILSVSAGKKPRAKTREEIVQILHKELSYLRARYGVKKMALYGSFAKGSYTTQSEVDILI